MTEPVLSVRNLCVQIQASEGTICPVKHVNFTIMPGQIFALVGESGSGKSLTALSVMRLLPENASIIEGSQIILTASAIHELSEVAMQKIRTKRVGMIFQDPALALNPVLTIRNQFQEVFLDDNIDLQETMRSLLARVRIQEPELCLQKYPHELSGGMKQRVMIAMALAKEPELLIADEPTTALDVTTQAEVLSLLKELNEKFKMAILFITHDLGIVAHMADNVAVMQEGKIIESHTTKDFFKQASHPYTLKLIQGMPESWPPRTVPVLPDKGEKPIVKVTDLSVYFPIKKGIFRRTVGYFKAVEGVSFEVYEGQTLAIVGESGSGKSTLAKAMLRLLPAQKGQIELFEKDFLALSSRALRKQREVVQIIFQDPYGSVDPRLTVAQIIEEGMRALRIGTDPAERNDRIRVLLEEVGLSENLRHRYPHELSGGQRQRVSIARALAVGPRLIICDEPTSSLDLSVQSQILALLKRIQDDLGISYVFITHNFGVVNYLADMVAVMYQGKCIEYGEAQRVLKAPKEPYTQQLLRDSLLPA